MESFMNKVLVVVFSMIFSSFSSSVSADTGHALMLFKKTLESFLGNSSTFYECEIPKVENGFLTINGIATTVLSEYVVKQRLVILKVGLDNLPLGGGSSIITEESEPHRLFSKALSEGFGEVGRFLPTNFKKIFGGYKIGGFFVSEKQKRSVVLEIMQETIGILTPNLIMPFNQFLDNEITCK
jgi:hypothetical protein